MISNLHKLKLSILKDPEQHGFKNLFQFCGAQNISEALAALSRAHIHKDNPKFTIRLSTVQNLEVFKDLLSRAFSSVGIEVEFLVHTVSGEVPAMSLIIGNPYPSEGPFETYAQNLVDVVESESTELKIFMLLPPFPELTTGLLDTGIQNRFVCRPEYFANFINRMEQSGYDFVDLTSKGADLGLRNVWSTSHFVRFGQHLCPELQLIMAQLIIAKVFGSHLGKIKIIACDLDDTLWGGNCQEVPPEDLSIGYEKSEAGAYYLFQGFLKDLKNNGLVLMALSKSEDSSIRQVFQSKSQMPLTINDFCLISGSEAPKHERLKSALEQINLLPENCLFVDDSPLEILEMQSYFPQVHSLLLSDDIAARIEQLRSHPGLRIDEVTCEDQTRTLSVQTTIQSQGLIRQSRAVWLEKLQMIEDWHPIRDSEVPRAIQLLQKTNQFNANLNRETQSELERYVREVGLVWILHLKDKYLDYGKVGLVLFRIQDKCLIVDNIVVSCRVFGREIEDRLLAKIENYALEMDLLQIEIRFQQTGKNMKFLSFVNQLQGWSYLPGRAIKRLLYKGEVTKDVEN